MMEEYLYEDAIKTKPWKKVLSVVLSLIIAFGTIIAIMVSSSKWQDWLGIQSMLSAYASEIVDTKGAVAVDKESMLADHNIIDLENKDGSNTVYLFSEPISYTDENGNLKTKDISVEKQSDSSLKSDYPYTNGQNDYRINFSTDSSKGLLITFDGGEYSIVPQSENKVEGKKNTSALLDEKFEVFEYNNIYGDGTNLKFYPQLNGVKDDIILNTNIGKNQFSFTINTKGCTAKLNDDGTVDLLSDKDKSVVQTFTAPYAYDSAYVEGDYNSHYSPCKYSLKDNGENTYTLTVTVDKAWLEDTNTAYPVTIDPTTSHIGLSADAGVYSKYSSNNYGSEQTCCFGKASDYGYGRTYTKFTVPTAIKKGATINSAYQWMRETTGRTSTTYVKPFMVNASWTESGIKWSNRSGYNPSVYGTRRNINSKSTDDSSNPYWYKFNIASAVKKWVDGTANYGMVYVSEDATSDGSYNWRAFTSRSYSSSAMRPYTVINYTNDTTAPTYTVTKSPTAWTNGNVTVTISGASDSGAGVASSGYSITTSTTPAYSSTKSKSFSSNCSVITTVKDNIGNAAKKTVSITNIDKLKPSTPTVTGAPSDWTNKSVTLTVKSTDAAATTAYGKSGVKYYCYTKTKGTYGSWQSVSTTDSSTTFTIDDSGTYYFYSKDQAGNISDPKEIALNIDKTKPTITDISVQKNETTNKTTVTVTATDTPSGIDGYSFDGGSTWQTENVKEFDSAPNTLSVVVKDKAGNTSSQIKDVVLPEFYEEGNLVGLVNPNANSTEKLQYKIGADGEWTTYEVPFAVPLYTESTIYAKVGENGSEISKKVTPNASNIGAYTESNTDFSINYYNASFDFTRSYNSSKKNWFYSTDSKITVVNNNVITATMTDGTILSFVKTADGIYKNEINGYTLSTIDSGYVIQIDDTNYYFDTNGLISAIGDKNDHKITITRTSSAITVSDDTNRAYTISLNSDGNITSITDPAEKEMVYSYNSDGKLSKVVDQSGTIIGQYSYTNNVLTKNMFTTIAYGSDGRVSSLTEDSGAYVNYTYDNEEKTVSTESSTETTSSQTYNDALLTVSSTDEDGKTTEYTYDDFYRVLTETTDGKTTTYEYDNKGNVVSEVSDDENAENTYSVYDSNNNLVRQQVGNKYTYYCYNENKENTLIATLKDGYSGEIPNSYDSSLTCFDTISYNYTNGLVHTSVDSKTNESITYTYDNVGNATTVSSITQKDNESTVSTTNSTYDAFGNVLTTTSGDKSSSYIYDNAGRTLLADDNGKCTRTIYDSLGRTFQTVSPEDYDASKDGLKAETKTNTYSDSSAGQTAVYASNGSLTSETNRLGQTTRYYYNDIGSKVREEFDIYKFYYLNHGELYQVKVAGATTVSYSYSTDGKFHLLQETYANDDVVRYEYNDNGDISKQYHNSNAKAYVTYTYNTDNELTQKVNTDSGLKYVYDGKNVSVYKTTDNTLVQSYVSTETEEDSETGAEAYTTVAENHFGTDYSSVTKDKSVTYSAGSNTIQYAYQTTGTDDDEKTTSDTVKNGDTTALSSSYTYDDNRNVLSKSVSVNGSTVNLANTYDSKGRIESSSVNGNTVNYTYDSNSQLTGATGTGYSSSYAYDSRGNITSKTVNGTTTNFTYANSGWKDQLVSVNNNAVTYDANGNVLTYGNKEYSWNTGRNLASITDGDNTYSYTYDENGIRTSKIVDGTTTYYNTQDGVILSQTDGTNTMYFQYDTSGVPLGFILNSVQYFYITNQMGDVVGITDNAGNILAQYTYDEWGSLLNVTGTNTDLANTNPIRYRGYYFDAETNYYYLQSRYYDSSICRFINSDIAEIAGLTKGIPAGTNLFAYCNNNSVNNEDPTGKISFNNVVGIVSILLSIYSAIRILASIALRKATPIGKFIDIAITVGTIAINVYNYFHALRKAKSNYGKSSSKYKRLIKYNTVILVANVGLSVVSYFIGRKYVKTKGYTLLYYLIKTRTYSIAGLSINIAELISGKNYMYRSYI